MKTNNVYSLLSKVMRKLISVVKRNITTLTVCIFLSCHVHFQSESTLYIFLNVKGLLA